MTRWLILRLRAPLASFGTVAVDGLGPTDDFPALSAITGLLANGLGFRRTEGGRLQRLQDRIVFAARRDAEPVLGRMTDFQTALLGAKDKGWTRGGVEGRAGGGETYKSPHIRRRDYHADARLTVVLTLREAGEAPTMEDVAAALDRPARPLFIGRKSCLPSEPFLAPEEADRWIEAGTARDALAALPQEDAQVRALWPLEEGGEGDRALRVTDRRDWANGYHTGARTVAEGRIVRSEP